MSHLGVQQVLWAKRHKNLSARMSPAALEVIVVIVIVIQTNDGVIAGEPAEILGRPENCPPVISQHVRRAVRRVFIENSQELRPTKTSILNFPVFWPGISSVVTRVGRYSLAAFGMLVALPARHACSNANGSSWSCMTEGRFVRIRSRCAIKDAGVRTCWAARNRTRQRQSAGVKRASEVALTSVPAAGVSISRLNHCSTSSVATSPAATRVYK